ncbi:hypothetical protein P171DRAFT_518662 [Karstenula rhodostoma CBS 690.94]|uniref:Uncharacterized protein n=1 Tax=Karstenula rhodostoma CBS 690.94 TaxID=1392251 RepID=A0A9P4UD90_9PLEO|nr:hypothetical protein P171DRAFT_518662 [Karstenula rhodostoma CBS 690.94]
MKLLSTFLGLSIALVTGVAAIGDCDSGPFAALQAVGDKHDASQYDVDICETQWPHGDYHQALNWDPFTVSVTRTVLWSDRDANQLGGMRIELSNGEVLEMKVDKISGKTFSPDVGSGIMLGGWGRADDHITAWGWLFLEDKVDKIQIGDFRWDQDQEEFAKSQAGIKKAVKASQGQYNAASNATTIAFDISDTVSNSYSYSQSVHYNFGMGYSLEISGQVAGVGPKSSFSVSFEVGQDFKKEWTQTQSTTLTFKVSQPALPGKTTMCIGYVEYGEFDMGYDANVHITLKNGKTFDFRERGERKQTMFGQAQTACADEDGDHSSESPEDFVNRHRPETTKRESRKRESRFISRLAAA